MAHLSASVIQSTGALRAAAADWDDLHRRSGLAMPVLKARPLALWCDHFAKGSKLHVVVIRDGGVFVGALPLVERRWIGMTIGELAGNTWSPAGDLLLDRQADVPAVCRQIVETVGKCGWPLVSFDVVPAAAPRWQAFWSELEEAAFSYVRRPRFSINVVRPGDDWDRYFATRSRAHRRRIRRAAAKATAHGETTLVCHDALAVDEVEPLLRQLFTIESSGWKGRQGSAVLNAPDVWDFFLAQAKQLAADGELNLVVLEHSGQPIAFEYGWQANGVYFSPKVSYDEAYAAYAPGQLLRAMWLERITRERHVETIDFLGPACPATTSWATEDYPMERALIGAGGSMGNTLIELYRRAGPAVRAARRWLGYPSAPTHRQEEVEALLYERQEAEEPAGVGV